MGYDDVFCDDVLGDKGLRHGQRDDGGKFSWFALAVFFASQSQLMGRDDVFCDDVLNDKVFIDDVRQGQRDDGGKSPL